MSQALVAVCAGFELSVRITILKYTQYRRQRGVQLCPAPHLKSVPPHFMFGAQLLHTSIIVLKECAPRMTFGPPCCEILATGLSTHSKFIIYVDLASPYYERNYPNPSEEICNKRNEEMVICHSTEAANRSILLTVESGSMYCSLYTH